MERNKMKQDSMIRFIGNALRAETFECPRSYIKAMCVTLIQCGYDLDWVYDEFKPCAYEMIISIIGGKQNEK